MENYTKRAVHRSTQTEYNHYILNFIFTNLPGGGCEGLKLARKKGGGGIALYPGGGTDIVTGNAGGTKLTAGTAGATGIFYHGKKKQATSVLNSIQWH